MRPELTHTVLTAHRLTLIPQETKITKLKTPNFNLMQESVILPNELKEYISYAMCAVHMAYLTLNHLDWCGFQLSEWWGGDQRTLMNC